MSSAPIEPIQEQQRTHDARMRQYYEFFQSYNHRKMRPRIEKKQKSERVYPHQLFIFKNQPFYEEWQKEADIHMADPNRKSPWKNLDEYFDTLKPSLWILALIIWHNTVNGFDHWDKINISWMKLIK